MSAKKSDFGLIIKLLVALAIGAFLGRMANVEVMDAVASVKYALGQIIFYAVPLVIVGFITPAVARLGQNASKMLLTAVAIAGVCIYRLDRKALRSAGLTGREAHRAALALAIITAPWTFLIPTPM